MEESKHESSFSYPHISDLSPAKTPGLDPKSWGYVTPEDA